MNNWYKQKAFYLILISYFLGKSVEIAASRYPNARTLDSEPFLENTDSNNSGKLFVQFTDGTLLSEGNYIEREMQLISLSNKSILPSNDFGEMLRVDNWLARQQNSCQNIDSAYQEVYSFQTDNYYISICQLGDSFYYHRQSKYDDDSTVLIPALAVSDGGVFQATSKRTTYFVGRSGDRYYSSVMQNDNEIIFEPELHPSSDTVLTRDLAEVNSQLPAEGVEVDRATNASLSDRPENNLDPQQALVCTGANTSNSPSRSWQQLLGESLNTASQYALSNGYSFIYDAQTPEQALITTSAAIVNLNIAVKSDTIEQVCIRPIAEN